MNKPKRLGDVSEIQSSHLGTSNAGNNSHTKTHIEKEVVSIQACRANLRGFLQRTRSRLQAITRNEIDGRKNNSAEHDANWSIQDAGKSQVFKPLAIPTPMLQRHNEQRNVNALTGEPLSQDPVEQDRSAGADSDRSSPSVTGHSAMEATTQVVAGSGCSEADWRVANAFDRNTYYGPTDFALMPDDSECPASSGSRSNQPHDVSDVFCSSASLIEFGGAHGSPSSRFRSSRLHLANQIRKN